VDLSEPLSLPKQDFCASKFSEDTCHISQELMRVKGDISEFKL
jgi:hypothetical protein